MGAGAAPGAAGGYPAVRVLAATAGEDSPGVVRAVTGDEDSALEERVLEERALDDGALVPWDGSLRCAEEA